MILGNISLDPYWIDPEIGADMGLFPILTDFCVDRISMRASGTVGLVSHI